MENLETSSDLCKNIAGRTVCSFHDAEVTPIQGTLKYWRDEMEKTGTFLNTEGHGQAIRPAIEPVGGSRPDGEIFATLSFLVNTPMEYAESRDILKEIRNLIHGYKEATMVMGTHRHPGVVS